MLRDTNVVAGDLYLAAGTIAMEGSLMDPRQAGSYVFIGSRLASSTGATFPTDGTVSLASDGAELAVDRPPMAGSPIGASSSSVWLLTLDSGAPTAARMAPVTGAPLGEQADHPAVGSWRDTEILVWNGTTQAGRQFAVISIGGRAPLSVVGLPPPNWASIDGPLVRWVGLSGDGDAVLYTIDVSALVASADAALRPPRDQ